MKRTLVIISVAVWAFGIMPAYESLSFSQHCWPTDKRASGGIILAIMWPALAMGFGISTVLFGTPGVYVCGTTYPTKVMP